MSLELPPHMSADEVALLSCVVRENANILEFGCGGSTRFFLEKGAKKLISIDSDAGWLRALLTNKVIATFHKHGKWCPVYADIGSTGNWGAPVDKTPQIHWLNYHQYCWNGFSNRQFDLILVDGRFRVACVCQALLRCDRENMLLAIHDFWNRPQYHAVLDFLDAIEKKDSLGIFKPKATIDWQELSLVLQNNQFCVV